MLHLILAGALLAGLDAPFSDLAYEAALAQAKAQSKLLLLDFTASWCAPCKRMEAEVWPRAEVRAWLGEHAIAIQVDVDEEPDLAQRFGIGSLPTIVALRGGEDFDRVVGYRGPAELLTWVKGVKDGKRASDALVERARELQQSEDVRARYELARELLQAKLYEPALVHYLWLWPASRSAPDLAGVRTTAMLAEMAALAKKHAPARQAFLGLLETLQAAIDAAEVPEQADWVEWSAMCARFDQGSRVLAWYEKRRDAEGRLFGERASEPFPERVVTEVFDALMRADRPQDAVRLFTDARKRAQGLVSRYEQAHGASAALDVEARYRMQEASRRELTNDVAELYVALLGVGRAEEAGDVASLLIRTLDTPDSRLALARAALAVEWADVKIGRAHV